MRLARVSFRLVYRKLTLPLTSFISASSAAPAVLGRPRVALRPGPRPRAAARGGVGGARGAMAVVAHGR